MTKEQEILQDLQNEKSSLAKNLRFAVDSNDGREISRLKQREKTIDSEIFSAEILALKAQISQAEAQLRADRENVVRAQELSKATDSLVTSQVSVLREEIQKLNSEAMSKLVAVKTAEKQAHSTGAKLLELREKLSKLLQ